ncbi:MAG: hypothetical protein Fur0022_09030 [Anaerolineales bacterium]
MQNQLSFENLLDWVEGRLSASDAERVAAIVAADTALQEEVAWIRKFHQTAEKTIWTDPPAEVLTALNRQFADYAAQNRPPSTWERLVAMLKFDSQMQPTASGVRATIFSGERQLVYQTAFVDIALTIQLSTPRKKYTILGQVLAAQGHNTEIFSVQLIQHGEEKAFAVTDEGGEFVFEGISGGAYELAIHSDQHEYIIIANIAL